MNWSLGTGLIDGLFLGALLLIIITYPLKHLLRFQRKLIYICLGIVTYLTLLTVARDLYALASGTTLARGWVFLGTLLLVAGGMLHSYLGPHVKKVKVRIPNLPTDLIGLKIAQISDLHVGPTVGRKYVDKVAKKTSGLNADIVTFTGDIGDAPPKMFGKSLQAFKFLSPRYGMFFVAGNHEHYWGVREWEAVMAQQGAMILHNSSHLIHVEANTILVAGIPDPVSRVAHDFDQFKVEADFKLLLSHRPGVAHEASKHGFNLQLSGHTHGGQFFPWTWVVKFVHEFDRGLVKVKDMWLYVNVGTGHWGPALRLGTTAEITLIELSS